MKAFAVAGVLVLAAAWFGPLAQWAHESFAAHMTMHVAVVAIAAPLIALGLAGTRSDPASRWPALFLPIPASVVEFVVIWAWHAPALHEAARHDLLMRVLEQGSFLAAGLLIWFSAFGGTHEGRDARRAAGMGGLLLTSMHMTLLGVLLAVAERPLYAHGEAGARGLAALDDQHLGGVIMLAVGGSAYLAGALGLLAMLLVERREGITRA